jgi:ubiquinone/menaquinone biosynthesis C-methylase UbiE
VSQPLVSNGGGSHPPQSLLGVPSADEQARYWTQWVEDSRTWEENPDNARRAECVLLAVEKAAAPPARVLDVGCGTGWIAMALAKRGYRVTGTDLASDAMHALARAQPDVTWIGGDFGKLDVGTGFDVAACMETIAHVPDQGAFARKLARVLRPGGTLVLTTQNPYVWNRTSWLKPPGPGQIRNWPTVDRLRELLAPYFKIEGMRTCAPGGDVGWLRLVHNGLTRRAAELVLGRNRWRDARERAFLGRSIVVVAKKNG